MKESNYLIEIRDIRKQYGKGEAAVYALDGIDFSLEEGKVCVVLGPSGSGKSTLLNMIGGLDSPDSGSIRIAGKEINGLEKGDKFTFRDIATLKKHTITVDGIIKNGYQNYVISTRENVAKITGLDEKNYNTILSKEKLDIGSSHLQETITDKTYENLMDNLLSAMAAMIYALMGIGIWILIASIYVTVNMMVSESTHNISMLKVLGYEDKKINGMVIDANHLLLVPGILLGMAAAYGIMAWYAAEFVEIESLIIPVSLAPKSIVITVALTAAAYFVSLAMLRRKVSKIDMIEALKDGRE